MILTNWLNIYTQVYKLCSSSSFFLLNYSKTQMHTILGYDWKARFFSQHYWDITNMTLCKFKMYNKMIWYTYTLRNNSHSRSVNTSITSISWQYLIPLNIPSSTLKTPTSCLVLHPSLLISYPFAVALLSHLHLSDH